MDTFQEQHMPIFGPTRNAARIESSKSFAKDLMQRHGVPCAQSQTFDRMDAAIAYIAEMGLPIVIKADGLAAGKGVSICFTHEEATTALEDALVRRTFGTAGAKVVVEEYLEGPEASLLAFCDGKTVLPMTPAADYKRAYDYDQGPNTGGMGAYSPPPYFGQAQVDEAKRTILEPDSARPGRGGLALCGRALCRSDGHFQRVAGVGVQLPFWRPGDPSSAPKAEDGLAQYSGGVPARAGWTPSL